jgi:hypothetical protein
LKEKDMSAHDEQPTTGRQREVLIALVNSVDGKDEEFQSWYWRTHVPEILAVPGFVRASCFRLPEEPDGLAPYRYATVYEVEGSAADARTRLFESGLGSSDALDPDGMIMAPFAAGFTIAE